MLARLATGFAVLVLLTALTACQSGSTATGNTSNDTAPTTAAAPAPSPAPNTTSNTPVAPSATTSTAAGGSVPAPTSGSNAGASTSGTNSSGGSASVSTSGQKQWSSPPPMTIDPSKTYSAVMHTTDGDMTFQLLPKQAPVTVNNFVFLAQQHFYDGVIFHRIVKGFMVQGGDPTGTGTGGPGYRFKDEPVTQPYKRGVLAMANAGPNTNGSQFFIVLQDTPLPPSYNIFGQLTSGDDTLTKIGNTPVTAGPNGEMSKPTQTVTITSIDIDVK